MHRYRVLKEFPHPDRLKGMCAVGKVVTLAPEQARYPLLGGEIELIYDQPQPAPEAAPQPAEEPRPARRPRQPKA